LLRGQLRPRADLLAGAGLEVEARGVAELRGRVDDAGFLRVDHDGGAVAAVDLAPRRGVAPARLVGRGAAHDPVVLESAGGVVGPGAVEGHRGELPDGKVVELAPALPVVVRDVQA